MIGQLNLWGKNKVEVAIDRLQSFEPKDGYYLAFSGGKDSQCIYHLAKMAGVKFDAHYRVTGVDPPELVRFIKEHYPDVEFELPKDADGKRITMWSLIASQTMPPLRQARYCCQYLKESGGDRRLTVTGVRWAESNNRKANQGEITIMKTGRTKAISASPDFKKTQRGGVILVNDNTESRRLMEQCIARGKITLNPIIDWEDDDVWEFLNDWAKVPHCKLYDEGFTRLGCIGCPLADKAKQKRDFERWPKFYDLYLRAFDKMVREHEGIRSWKTGEDVMRWWLSTKEERRNGDV